MVRARLLARVLVLIGLGAATLAFAATANRGTHVTYSSGFAISRRVSELPIGEAPTENVHIHEPGAGPLRSKTNVGALEREDAVVQQQALSPVGATVGVSFPGMSSPGYQPSDSNLAVGPNHIVEVVNVNYAVYSKTGGLLAGPTSLIKLFAPLSGDICNGTFGDPIVLYDRAADRWLISMIGSNSIASTAAECVAISQTNDPTGAYYLYGYPFGGTLNDYPKLSTWATTSNSAYLATFNLYLEMQNLNGADICGFDRAKMLVGDPTAALLCQLTPNTEFGYLPSDMDGPTPPVDGTPGLFINWQNNAPGQLYLRTLTLNFASATATLSAPTVISVADQTMACTNGGQCIPQAGVTQTLDSLGDRLMYRFAIRHFADHDRAVLNHAVANGSQVAVRWYELYDPAGAVTVNQQGTFAPDATYRWMASIAEDQSGDIGLGYSASSSSINPAICFTGRVPSDPSGTMESEATILQGAGSQLGSFAYRWGDYTAMQVDPSDDCTFWYVDQYEPVNGTFNWSTNIASFIFNTCSPGPNFSLGAGPNALTISPASPGTTTITVVPTNGFSDSVDLSASGLPTGVTAKFQPASTASTSLLTLTAGASSVSGVSTVTITGTSGSITQTTTLQLTVNGPSFSLSASPNAVSVVQGNQNTTTITVNPINGFAGSPTLSVSNLPSGVTAGFSPNPTSSTSTLTLTAGATASPGTTAITVSGVYGGVTQTTTVNVTVNAGPNFSLTANPNSVTVLQGTQGTSTITVVPVNGFTGSPTLSASNLPSGVTAGFSPNPTSSTSTLTLTASSTATLGTSTITISGVSGGLTQTTTLILTVTGPTFTLTANPNTLSVSQGSQNTTTITVVPVNGFSGSPTLSASNLPSGVTAGFSPNPTSSTSTLTLTASGSATLGTSTITVSGVSGNLTANTTVSLTVTAPPTFNLTVNPNALSVVQGNQNTTTVTVVPLNGFSGSPTLSASNLPSGVTAGLSPNPTSSTSTLTLTATATATLGTSAITISGISGSLTASTTLNLTVASTATFSLTANPGTLTVAPGSSVQSVITVNPTAGFTGTVKLTATGMPTKVTAAFSPASTTSTSALTLTAAAKAAIGAATITITGKSGTITQTVTVNLTVAAGPTTATATPTSLSWAKVAVGATGAAKTVTLKNTGKSTLNISRISTTGDFTSQGGGANDCLSTLAVGSSCTVTVVFQPTQTGTRTGSLVFTDDASNSPQTVTLSGTGK